MSAATSPGPIPLPERRRNRRKYSDLDRAKALVALKANGGNALKTAAEIDIPRRTLQLWKENEPGPFVAELCQETKPDLATRFEQLANLCLDAAPDKIPEATLAQVTVSAGISVDKMQNLRASMPVLTDDADDAARALDRRLAGLAARLRVAGVPGEPDAAGAEAAPVALALLGAPEPAAAAG